MPPACSEEADTGFVNWVSDPAGAGHFWPDLPLGKPLPR